MKRQFKEIPVIKRFLQTAFVGAAIAGFSGLAQADTVQTIITNQYGGVFGTTDDLVLNDADATFVVDGTTGLVKTTGALAVGDIFIGTLKITSSQVGDPSDPTHPLNQGVHQGLVGFYAIKVSAITDVAGSSAGLGTDDTVSGSWITDLDLAKITANTGISALDLASYGFGDTSGKTMLAFFIDGDADGDAVGSDDIYSTPFVAGHFDSVIDGGLWASFGGDAATYTLTDSSGGKIFDVGAAGASTDNSLADVELSLGVVVDNVSYLQFNSPMTQDNRAGNNNANILIGGAGVGPVKSDISFLVNATLVPTPAAVLPGLAMFGIAALRRGRRTVA